MKIFLAFILFSSSAFAIGQKETLLDQNSAVELSPNKTPVNFVCSTEHPTTSVSVETVEEKVYLRVLHHNGLKFAPIHSGVITLHDIPYLEKKGGLFARMGEHLIL